MREYTVKNWGHILTNYNLTAEPHNLDAGQKSDLELDQSPFEGVAL